MERGISMRRTVESEFRYKMDEDIKGNMYIDSVI